MTFRTACGRDRALSLPDPAAGLDRPTVHMAADSIVMADVFDDAPGGPGRLTHLRRADLQKIATTVLF